MFREVFASVRQRRQQWLTAGGTSIIGINTEKRERAGRGTQSVPHCSATCRLSPAARPAPQTEFIGANRLHIMTNGRRILVLCSLVSRRRLRAYSSIGGRGGSRNTAGEDILRSGRDILLVVSVNAYVDLFTCDWCTAGAILNVWMD